MKLFEPSHIIALLENVFSSKILSLAAGILSHQKKKEILRKFEDYLNININTKWDTYLNILKKILDIKDKEY